jgi:nitrogen fixation/metabolism regulation signal transduction histidine kinase
MDETSLVKLLKALTKIVASDVHAQKLVNAKREANWNEVIRRLSKE